MSVVILETTTTTTQPAPQAAPDLARLWWLPLVSGIASLGVGIAALVNPSRTARILFGAFAVVAGLLVVRHPGDSLLLISLATGIFLVLAGIVRFVRALGLPGDRGLPIAAALVDFAAGVVLVAWPEFSIKTFSIVLGISLLFRGTVEIATAFMVRRAA